MALFEDLFELVDCRGLLDECKTNPNSREREDSKSLHMLHLTTPINQSRSNSAQSLEVVAAHVCVKTTAETDSLHSYVVDLL